MTLKPDVKPWLHQAAMLTAAPAATLPATIAVRQVSRAPRQPQRRFARGGQRAGRGRRAGRRGRRDHQRIVAAFGRGRPLAGKLRQPGPRLRDRGAAGQANRAESPSERSRPRMITAHAGPKSRPAAHGLQPQLIGRMFN